MTRESWECSDERDAWSDARTFLVYDFNELGAMNAAHHCVLYLLGCPRGNIDRAVVVDRYVTRDLRGLTRSGFNTALKE